MSLTSVGKLLNKVVRIPNGREKREIYQFLTTVGLKECISYAPMTTFCCCFYHSMTRLHISKQYHKNRNIGTVLIIRKTRKNLPPTPNFASKLAVFTTHSRFY